MRLLVFPNLSAYATYTHWLRTALKALQSQLLIIGGSTPVEEDKLKLAIRSAENLTVFQTGSAGAVSATLLPNGTTRLSTHLSRRSFTFDISQ